MRKIFVAGHKGMVGSAICRQLKKRCDVQVVTRTRQELDLLDQQGVKQFMRLERPDEIILAAAKVGGIHANKTYPAEFIYENLQIQMNIIHSAHLNDIQKILFLGSSCIYPRNIAQPMRESALLTGALEYTNEPYAIAKIAGIKICESYNRQYGRDYRSIMPTNLYGPGDSYHPENSHVVPALIRRFHEAKANNQSEVVVWGSGSPLRELLFVDDMAHASLFIHDLDAELILHNTLPMQSHINIGSRQEITIKGLAETIRDIVGFKGEIVFDASKPDGNMRKLMDTQLINRLGWSAQTELKIGLMATYTDFKNLTAQL